jgi:hypothetical protein
MTACIKWQTALLEGVASKTGLVFSENSILLKTEQDFAEDTWASIANEMGIYRKRHGHLSRTTWATAREAFQKSNFVLVTFQTEIINVSHNNLQNRAS